jgi:hypothetical protein
MFRRHIFRNFRIWLLKQSWAGQRCVHQAKSMRNWQLERAHGFQLQQQSQNDTKAIVQMATCAMEGAAPLITPGVTMCEAAEGSSRR